MIKIRGPRPAWRTEFSYENCRDPEYPDVTFPVEAVRTGAAKLGVSPGHAAARELVKDLPQRLDAARHARSLAVAP